MMMPRLNLADSNGVHLKAVFESEEPQIILHDLDGVELGKLDQNKWEFIFSDDSSESLF
jgi:hypothetical protein